MDKMNELLKKLYSSKWEKISYMLQSFNKEKPNDSKNSATHPLLIKTNKEYETSDFKVMFFGQETNYWERETNDGAFEEGIDIETLLNRYDIFYLKRGYEGYGGHFWNFIRKLKNSEIDKKIGYVWNNVLKIGKCGKGYPEQGLINYTFEYFNVISQEIEILKPNVLLFLSSYRYDEFIKRSLGNFSIIPIDGFNKNELCILKFDNLSVDLALRTYHPGYLHRLGKERMNKILNKIRVDIHTAGMILC